MKSSPSPMMILSPVQLTSETRCPNPPARVNRRAMTVNTNAKAPPIYFYSYRPCRVGVRSMSRNSALNAILPSKCSNSWMGTFRMRSESGGSWTTSIPTLPAALYSVFSPEEARRITRKLEFHYTPKHGSWLNMAECEFAVLARQCLNRRIASIETLREEIAAWQGPRNQLQTKIHWQFGTDLARTKLKRLYPPLESSENSVEPETPEPVKTSVSAH